MSVDIECLSIDPLTQWTLFFLQSILNDPFFPLCLSNFTIQIAHFCALRAHFEKFLFFFSFFFFVLSFFLFFFEIAFLHTKWPPNVLISPHWMTPFFQRNITPNSPYSRFPVGICTSLSYSSVPPPVKMLINILVWRKMKGIFYSFNPKRAGGGGIRPPFDIFCYISAGCYFFALKLLDFFPSSLALDLRPFL